MHDMNATHAPTPTPQHPPYHPQGGVIGVYIYIYIYTRTLRGGAKAPPRSTPGPSDSQTRRHPCPPYLATSWNLETLRGGLKPPPLLDFPMFLPRYLLTSCPPIPDPGERYFSHFSLLSSLLSALFSLLFSLLSSL